MTDASGSLDPLQVEAGRAAGIMLAVHQGAAERAAERLVAELGWSIEDARQFVASKSAATCKALADMNVSTTSRGLSLDEAMRLQHFKFNQQDPTMDGPSDA